MTAESSTDRIVNEIHLTAPRSRVWRAIADAREFSVWFGIDITGDFVAGQIVIGRSPNPKYADIAFDLVIETIQPETVFAYRWHPYALDANVDYSVEPRTLVTFTLSDVDSGTLLRVVESGFDAIPAHRRAIALEMNTGGWTAQMQNVARYVTGPAT